MERGLTRPEGLSDFSGQVFDVLARYTMFPWPVLKTQAERVGVDPARITPVHLDGPLLDYLAAGVARFTSSAKGDQVRGELAALVMPRSRRTARPPAF